MDDSEAAFLRNRQSRSSPEGRSAWCRLRPVKRARPYSSFNQSSGGCRRLLHSPAMRHAS